MKGACNVYVSTYMSLYQFARMYCIYNEERIRNKVQLDKKNIFLKKSHSYNYYTLYLVQCTVWDSAIVQARMTYLSREEMPFPVRYQNFVDMPTFSKSFSSRVLKDGAVLWSKVCVLSTIQSLHSLKLLIYGVDLSLILHLIECYITTLQVRDVYLSKLGILPALAERGSESYMFSGFIFSFGFCLGWRVGYLLVKITVSQSAVMWNYLMKISLEKVIYRFYYQY